MPPHAFRDIVRLAWPVYVSQIAVMANGVIDTVMAGRYGTLDLAAVGIGASIYATLFITLMSVLFALTPIAAQAYGAGRHAAIGESVRQCAWLAVWLAIVSIVLLKHPQPLFALSRLAPDVEARTAAYLDAIAWAVPTTLLFRVFAGFSTAISRPRAVMAFNLAGLALKVPLNWVLMNGELGLPVLGAAGCAAATAVIAWLTCCAAWIWCWRERDYRRYHVFERWSWPRARAQWQLVALGVPIGATFFVDVTAFTFMALFIARSGALWSGAHQIVANLAALAFMLPLAIGIASGVLVGQALGAGAPGRARTMGLAGIALGLASGAAIGATLFLAARPIVALYTTDPEVRPIAVGLLALVGVYHLFDALQVVAVNGVRAYERTAVPMLIYAVALWGVALGGGYVLGITGFAALGSEIAPLGARGFWLAAIAGMVLTAALVTAYFLRLSRAGALFAERARSAAA
ncbi:MAG TPA: MATE family efflux transporter [Burkholderiales bacterium]|nr:MATE family efflux transporter [Burkholderiales bacterium]